MPLKQSPHDDFEDRYEAKFRQLAAGRGIIIEYRRDRAAIDLGVHLSIGRDVTDTRAWFQFKGIHSGTLSAEEYRNSADVPIDLAIEHLRQWYRSPEAVYLVVYVESADCFLAVDTRDLVDKCWGDEIFRPSTFKSGQTLVRARVPTSAHLDDALWDRMLGHHSMRTDGPSFRGNPLGHSYDPHSRIPLIMDPELYREVVQAILNEHRFRVDEVIEHHSLFVGEGDEFSLCVGKMFDSYEWVLQMTAQLICDSDGYREDGKPFRVQGRCGVLIHSRVVSRPSIPKLKTLAEVLTVKGIGCLLVFVNHHLSACDETYYNCLPEYREAMQCFGIECVPQHLEDLGRNILVSSNVYNRFRERIDWWGISHLKRQHGEIFLLKYDGTSERL